MTAPRPGKRILYLPDRFFGQGAQAPFTAAETPGYVAGDDRDDRDLFPFHAPTGFASGNRNLPKQTQCISLLPAPLSTDRQQTTDIATVIKGLPHHRRLQTIKRCRTLWARLQAYADHEHLGHNTWNLPGAVFPDSVQQYEAVTSLSAWFVSHASRKSYAMVNCEAAVQDEVRAQLVAPLNDLIKTRYANRAMEPLKGVKKGWVDKYGTILASPPPDVFYPEYGRPNHAEHPEQGRNKAGFPDFILHNTASKDASGAFMEVKFFASFSDEVFMQIFSPVSAEPGSGQFNWGERKLVTKLLMQVWGEAHFFNSVWGSATNGSLICAFIKTGDRELTLSEPVSWESPGVLKALAGLTFASVDEKTARRQGIDLVDVLCPLQERDTGWMQTGANQPYHMHVGMFQGGIQNAGPAHQGVPPVPAIPPHYMGQVHGINVNQQAIHPAQQMPQAHGYPAAAPVVPQPGAYYGQQHQPIIGMPGGAQAGFHPPGPPVNPYGQPAVNVRGQPVQVPRGYPQGAPQAGPSQAPRASRQRSQQGQPSHHSSYGAGPSHGPPHRR